jgi:peptide/nickel transport system substrate-binding protein
MAKVKLNRGGRRIAALGAALTVLLSVTGCQLNSSVSPSPTPSGAPPRPFTVMSTDLVRVTDPAAITDAASAVVSLNVFQRLMTADPGQSVLKPDAARDCIFTSTTIYSCTLNEGLTFHNGHPLTASDVKFSVQRATRLNVAGSSTSLLSSLRRIETPDDRTVRFRLSRPDTQFGWALASPAASIVDEEVYPQDDIRPPNESVVGSGPFAVAHRDERSLLLTRHNAYVGRNPAQMQAVEYRTAPDSASIEDAMANGKVDVVWRGLNAAAITRYSRQVESSADRVTTDGFTEHTHVGERGI